MREIRPYGSEGGELRLSLPLSFDENAGSARVSADTRAAILHW